MRRRAPSMPPSRLSRSSKPRRDDDCRPGVMGVTKLPKRTMNLPPIDPPRVLFLRKSHILTKISHRTPVDAMSHTLHRPSLSPVRLHAQALTRSLWSTRLA